MTLADIYREEGKKEGKREGELKGKQDVAKKLKRKGFSIDDIIEVTGLTRKNIESI